MSALYDAVLEKLRAIEGLPVDDEATVENVQVMLYEGMSSLDITTATKEDSYMRVYSFPMVHANSFLNGEAEGMQYVYDMVEQNDYYEILECKRVMQF